MIRSTKKGFEKIKKDYEEAVRMRPAAVADLKKARDMGDLSENGYYKAARFKLSHIDYLIRKLSLDIKKSVVIEKAGTDYIDVGSTVELQSKDGKVTYSVVGDLEANPQEKKISLMSPLGKAISGKKVGDSVAVETQSGKTEYQIQKIS
ncbi:MAG: GreA/GreB family elongation factor [Candidatus Levyibacteriota bacterium]